MKDCSRYIRVDDGVILLERSDDGMFMAKGAVLRFTDQRDTYVVLRCIQLVSDCASEDIVIVEVEKEPFSNHGVKWP